MAATEVGWTIHSPQQGSCHKCTHWNWIWSMRLVVSIYRYCKCFQYLRERLLVHGQSRHCKEQSIHFHGNQELSAQCWRVLMPGLNFPVFLKPICIGKTG